MTHQRTPAAVAGPTREAPRARRSPVVALAILAAVIALAGTTAAAVHAATAAEIQRKLEAAREKIHAAEQKKKTLGEQIGDLDGRLTTIQKRLDGLGDQIAAVEEKLSVTREKLAVLREELRIKRIELKEAQDELALEQRNLARRAVLSYKSDDLGYFDVLLAATSFEDLISRAGLIRIFRDMVLIREFETMLDRIKKEGSYQGIEYQHKGPAHLSIGQEAAAVGQDPIDHARRADAEQPQGPDRVVPTLGPGLRAGSQSLGHELAPQRNLCPRAGPPAWRHRP